MREHRYWRITTPNETEEMAGEPWKGVRKEMRFCTICGHKFKGDEKIHLPNSGYRFSEMEMNLLVEETNCKRPFESIALCDDCSTTLENKLDDLIGLPKSVRKNRLNIYIPNGYEGLLINLKKIDPDKSWSELVMDAIRFYVEQNKGEIT